MEGSDRRRMKTRAPVQNLIRAMEVWELNAAQDRLVWSSGAYGDLEEMREASTQVTFDFGEGLPGAAWQTRTPVILHSLLSGNFKRVELARDSGMECGIAWPCFQGEVLRGVVVLFCGAVDGCQGAFEVWSRNERNELGLSASLYANLERFGRISHFVKFPRGAGLPGQTWEMRFPKVLNRLGDNAAFLRASGARAEGLQEAISFPIMRSSIELDSIILLLSSGDTPIYRAAEIWVPEENQRLRLHSATYAESIEYMPSTQNRRCQWGEGIAGRVLSQNKPLAVPDASSTEPRRSEELARCGVSNSVGIPVYVGNVLVAVVVLFL